jgi:membrane protein YdbS with pleckstrin-like domain
MATRVSTQPRPSRPQAPLRRPAGPEGQRPLRAWAVVAIWAVLLGVLVATDAGFGNNAVVLEISGSSAGFVLLLASAVWLDKRLRPYRGLLRHPTRVGGVFLFAVAATLAWLSLAFGAWTIYIAVVPLIAAVGLEAAARRRRRQR